MTWFFALLFAACSTTSVELAQDCDVRLSELAPSSAAAGDTVIATVKPVTTVWDTAVYMGSTRAEVVDVERANCDSCDQCKKRYDCTECEDCDECDEQCAADCIETVSFKTIATSTGSVPVSIFNGYGQSNSVPIEIIPTSISDTSNPDTGVENDASSVDSGTADATDSGGAETSDGETE